MSIQRYLCGLIERFHPVLRRGSDPLRAELLACEFLGALGAPTPGQQEADGAAPRSLVELVAQIEACDTREALAALRALAVVAPSARAAASAAADRVAAGGLQEPTWVENIGTPEIGTSCGYLDPAGGQETVHHHVRLPRTKAARLGGAHRPQPRGRVQGLLGE